MAQRRAPPSNPRASVFIIICQHLRRGSAVAAGAGYADLPAETAGWRRQRRTVRRLVSDKFAVF